MSRKIKIAVENRGTTNFDRQEVKVDADDFAVIISNLDGTKNWEARISVDENNCPVFIYAEVQATTSWGMPAIKIKHAKS